MPRHKAFVREEALERAMDLFWAKGYEAASLQELVKHMGIGRSSLYDTFGSKHELWAEALSLYGRRMQELMLAPLRGDGSPRERIAKLFAGVIERKSSGELPSCLLMKALLTTGEHCEDTAECARASVAKLEQELCAVLHEARQAGELGSKESPERLARVLVALLHGLGVSASVDCNPERLTDISELALALLD
ncbi:MAG: TetR family transcriptional regulator [Planctomycetota bacterium]|nr:MAG: TetR family transcriptional regulator [Planctomycetota bacterium]